MRECGERSRSDIWAPRKRQNLGERGGSQSAPQVRQGRGMSGGGGVSSRFRCGSTIGQRENMESEKRDRKRGSVYGGGSYEGSVSKKVKQ